MIYFAVKYKIIIVKSKLKNQIGDFTVKKTKKIRMFRQYAVDINALKE